VAAKKSLKPKHVPQRTCVGCREVLPKRQLLRLVRSEDGVVIDTTAKMNGRGAYLHDQRSCWKKALKGSLAAALRTSLTAGDFERLTDYMERLPAEPDAGSIQVQPGDAPLHEEAKMAP
jgi:predicted RNA-binding protein YlxR (DUF448 family)